MSKAAAPGSLVPAFAATPVSSIPQLVADVRSAFASRCTRPIAWRIAQLRGLLDLLDKEKASIISALNEDLRRPEMEGVIGEILSARGEVMHALTHIHEWVKARPVPVSTLTAPADAYVQPEPLGVVLIMGPWNFPLMLLIAPLGEDRVPLPPAPAPGAKKRNGSPASI